MLYIPGSIQEVNNPCTGCHYIEESDEFKMIKSDYDETLKLVKTLVGNFQKIEKIEVDTHTNTLKIKLIQSIEKLLASLSCLKRQR